MASVSSEFLSQIESRIEGSESPQIRGETADIDREQVNVLVVEDEGLVADMYEDWVANAGYQTDVANRGRQALEQIDGETDVVLLDRRMPLMTGDEVLQVIRSDDIQELDPGAFAGADNAAIREQFEEHGVTDLDLETAEKLNEAVVENVQAHDLDPQVCMVTAVDPGFEILDLEFEHYITKEIDPEELIDIVDALTVMGTLEENIQEYQSLRWKEILLVEEMDRIDVETDERYQELQDRMSELERDAGKLVEAIKAIDTVPGS